MEGLDASLAAAFAAEIAGSPQHVFLFGPARVIVPRLIAQMIVYGGVPLPQPL